MTQVTPLAVLAGGLIGLGLLARQNEFVAMRACGVSIWQVRDAARRSWRR